MQISRHPASQQQGLASDLCGDIGIAVPITAHPGSKTDWCSGWRQTFSGGREECRVHTAQQLWQGLPQRVFDDRKAPLRFIHRGGSLATDFVGVPSLGDDFPQASRNFLTLNFWQVGMILSCQLDCDAVVLLD
ncbi:hypothetical protein D3C76_515700 [compost metagenome]